MLPISRVTPYLLGKEDGVENRPFKCPYLNEGYIIEYQIGFHKGRSIRRELEREFRVIEQNKED